MSYVTFQWNSRIGSRKTGLIYMKYTVKGNKNYGHITQVIA